MAEKRHSNNVRELREAQLMSKAELARKAGLSPLTIDRVEGGKPCRMDTKRKIILALGLKLADRHRVFPEEGPTGASKKRRDSAGARETEPGRAEGGPEDTPGHPADQSGVKTG